MQKIIKINYYYFIYLFYFQYVKIKFKNINSKKNLYKIHNLIF